MTWAEYSIRLNAYLRLDLKEWKRTREVAYYSAIGSHLDYKRIPSKEEFMQLSSKKQTLATDRMIDIMNKARDKYMKDKKDG